MTTSSSETLVTSMLTAATRDGRAGQAPASSTNVRRNATGAAGPRPAPPSAVAATAVGRPRRSQPTRRRRATRVSSSQWAVAVLAPGKLLALRAQQLEAGDDLGPRVGGIDHVVHVAPFGGTVRIGEALGVLLDQLGLASVRIGSDLQLAAVDDLDRTLWSHHGELR